MGRSPCCDADANMRRGPWLTEEDEKLREYIEVNGAGNWKNLPKLAGLNRCGKSCRLRWANYLRPDIKRGRFSEEEEQTIIHLHSILGNKWSAIAARLAGRTDNEIKNYWNTHLRKKLLNMGIDPVTHRPRTDLNLLANVPLNTLIAAAAAAANLSNLTHLTANPLLINALQLPQLQLLQNLLQVAAANSSPPNFDATNLLGSPFLNGSLGLRNPDLMALENLSNNLLDTTMMPNLSSNGTEAVIPPMNTYCSSSSSSWEHGVGNNCGGTSSSYITTTTRPATSTPSLVSASPENSIAEQVQEPVNDSRRNIAVSSPTSKPFDAWDGLNLDELDSDLGISSGRTAASLMSDSNQSSRKFITFLRAYC